ncbi:MAG TPA: YncE family protein [Vicinamibacterales bacterium]|nr:YncE family protein [Vicinamibacterales bacterium]
MTDGHSTIGRRGAAAIAVLLIAAGTLGGGVSATGGLAGILYVTDRSANRVWALDASDGSVLASSPTGPRPIGVEKANGKVYTADESSSTMSVYDGCTLRPLTVIHLTGCPRPHHTHTSSDGSRVYVACFATNKVAVVDTDTDTLEALWTSGVPGAVTHQPWATKDDERVWATNTASHDITELDAGTGAILRIIPTRPNPIETVTPANGKLAYVSIPGQNKLQIFDLETALLVAELDVPAPENLMISGNGKRVLASTGGRRVPNTSASIIDTRTRTFTTVALPGTLATHNDLTHSGKYGFVSLEGPPHGLAVIDMDAASVQAFYAIPQSTSPHGVRWAPSCR